MRPDELCRYDGKEGRPAYIAYKGDIYDVTENPMWENGEHMGRLQAGSDLTEYLSQAPHGEEVFDNLPKIGHLEGAEEQDKPLARNDKEWWRMWYQKYHPHPMTVHFPIALHFFSGGMDLLFLFRPSEAYEIAVFYSFFVATAMGVVAMVPGILSWWINYDFARLKPLMIKLYVASFTLVAGIIAVGLRLEDPRVAFGSGLFHAIYHGVIFTTVLTVIVLGYYGGKLTWSRK